MPSARQFLQPPARPDIVRPRLDLSGPILAQALQSLVAGTEAQGGIEQWIDALKLKSRMFQQALEPFLNGGEEARLPLDSFASLCAFMASVRRRVGPFLEEPAYGELVQSIARLLWPRCASVFRRTASTAGCATWLPRSCTTSTRSVTR
jgi:hypothetical protein